MPKTTALHSTVIYSKSVKILGMPSFLTSSTARNSQLRCPIHLQDRVYRRNSIHRGRKSTQQDNVAMMFKIIIKLSIPLSEVSAGSQFRYHTLVSTSCRCTSVGLTLLQFLLQLNVSFLHPFVVRLPSVSV